MAVIPATRLYAARPGQPAPIEVLVNRVALLHACPSASLQLPPSPSVNSSEGLVVSAEAWRCSFLYSSYLTPSIASVSPTTVSQAQQTLSLTGARFSGSASDISITVAGVSCPITAITASEANQTAAASNSTASSSGPPPPSGPSSVSSPSSPADAAAGFEPTYTISCALPMLPAGQNELRVLVAGSGAAELLGAAARLSLAYAAALTSIGPARGSFHGGTDITISGANFAPMPPPAAGALANRTTTVAITGGPPGNPFRLDVLQVNLTTITARLRRSVISSGSSTSTLSFRVTVTDAVAGTSSSSGTSSYALDKSYSPAVANLAPTSLAAASTEALTFDWSAGTAAAGAVAAEGNSSRVTVQLTSYGGGGVQASYACGGAVALSSKTSSNSYSERVSCSPPGQLPAGSYVLWACLPSGCGYAATNLIVDASIIGISPNTSTVAGGQVVAISGLGFSGNASQVSARFGASPCRVLAANFTTITCRTTAAASTSEATSATLALVPALGAPELLVRGLDLLYDPAATPVITSIAPSKGSSEGGTLLTVTGE
jgi:hypothetical protein